MTESEPLPAEATSPRADGGAYEFPGCHPIRITRDEIADYDGRYEYWEARTETAWEVNEPTSPYHELPSQRLARLSDRIAAIRGSPIETFGTSDLLVRDAKGARHSILQADQILYLNPGRSQPPGHAVEIGQDDLPDVILEVDLTTDVRRGKLAIYESWRFPEVWVDVPDERSPSTGKTRPSTLTIYLLEDGRYRTAPASVAFAGWTAAEIHKAMNERDCSAETVAVLTRVGRVLGERLGTGPDDDPFLGVQRRESRAEGERAGATKVFEVMQLLGARDIAISQALIDARDLIVEAPLPALQRAAIDCADGDDFLRRLKALT
ncbi:MAG: Uma2 family endonuclease [Gammaproteobacteria bacterium]|nr:Uma2 family endonuclease [Gammaproteobacteria bacterium]